MAYMWDRDLVQVGSAPVTLVGPHPAFGIAARPLGVPTTALVVRSERVLDLTLGRHLLAAGVEPHDMWTGGPPPGPDQRVDAVIAVGPDALSDAIRIALDRRVPVLAVQDARRLAITRADLESAQVIQRPATRVAVRNRDRFAMDSVTIVPAVAGQHLTVVSSDGWVGMQAGLRNGFELRYAGISETPPRPADLVWPTTASDVSGSIAVTTPAGGAGLRLDAVVQHVTADTTVLIRTDPHALDVVEIPSRVEGAGA